MFVSETQIRVRYAETDQMGYVYYGNYAMYFEVARVETIRALGLNYKELEDGGVMMPVLDLKCQYLAPAKYDDLLTIKVTIKDMPGVKIKYFYEVFNEAKELLHKAETTLVFAHKDTGRPCRPPIEFMNVLKPHFE